MIVSVIAQAFLGIAIYAAQNKEFPCKNAIRSLSGLHEPAISILWRSFGHSNSCIRSFADNSYNKTHLIVIHSSNEWCRRHLLCTKQDFLPKLSVKLLNKALEEKDFLVLEAYKKRFLNIQKQLDSIINPNTQVLISTGLEDNYTQKAFRNLKKALRVIVKPPYELIRNPVANINSYNLIELHGNVRKAASNKLVSLDGLSITSHKRFNRDFFIGLPETKSFIKRHRKNSFAVFLWKRQWQGVRRSFVPPIRRKFRFTKADVLTVKSLFKDKI